MLLVGKQVWFGRTVLAAYMLLVCFGHALHALPGHQHGGASCECSAHLTTTTDPSSCTDNCSTKDQCKANQVHQHAALDCPFGHASKLAADGCCVIDKANDRQGDPNTAPLSFQDAGCDGLCLICELLAAPQAAAVCVDITSATAPVAQTTETLYSLFVADVSSNFSARGPPSLFA